MRSVVVGVAARQGDLLFPDYLAYLESALRVEDQIFRMTGTGRALPVRRRPPRGRGPRRIFGEFCDEFPSTEKPSSSSACAEIKPGLGPLTVEKVLTAVFGNKEALHKRAHVPSGRFVNVCETRPGVVTGARLAVADGASVELTMGITPRTAFTHQLAHVQDARGRDGLRGGRGVRGGRPPGRGPPRRRARAQ